VTPEEPSILPNQRVKVGTKTWTVGALVQTGGERYLLLIDRSNTVFLCPRRDATLIKERP